MNKYTLIVHFTKRHIGVNTLSKIANDLAKVSGLNVLCFDNDVELTLVEVDDKQSIGVNYDKSV